MKSFLVLIGIVIVIVVFSGIMVSCVKQAYVKECASKNAHAVHSGTNSYICVDDEGRIVP